MKGVLTFSAQTSRPEWRGDFGGREHILPIPAKIDATAFRDKGGYLVKMAAAALAAATSITVDALPQRVLAGTVLMFAGTKPAVVTADAAAGATSISVAALAVDIADNDEARYHPGGGGAFGLYIPSGTLVGRTFAEAASNAAFGPGDDTDDELYLTYNEVLNAFDNPDIELYRHGSLVKENYLPEWDTISADADLFAAMRTVDTCVKGRD